MTAADKNQIARRFIAKTTLTVFTQLLTLISHASIELEAGSYANRTHIDTVLRRANLNFVYNGCDPRPDASRIRITTNGNCQEARNFNLGTVGNQTAVSGTVGEMIVSYDEPNPGACTNRTTRRLHANLSLQDAYDMFQRQNCAPTYLVLRDGTTPQSRSLVAERDNRRLCSLPNTRVTKANFPTEEFSLFNLFANDSGFRMGDHTHYRYDHNSGNWCVRHRENDERCGQWPSPLPMAYQDSSTGRFHVRGTVSLNPDGRASIRAINKSYASLEELYNDQRNGGLTQTDTSRGRIDFHTWRRSNGGVIRSLVSSYETDEANATHQRSLNFIGRNVMGVGVTHSWCAEEHCFAGVQSERLSRCGASPSVELTRGGNGNTCHSCLGITPGLCAVEPEEVNSVRSRLIQDADFRMLDSGEYQFSQTVEQGLLRNFERIVANPRNPGCHTGYAPAFQDIFDPGASGERSVNTVPKGKTSNPKKP